MQLNQSSFNLDSPESWLIVLSYAGFLIYSYYSLVICLINIRKKNRLLETKENPIEVTG